MSGDRRQRRSVWLIFGGVIAACLLYPVLIHAIFPQSSAENSGQFGDSFGALNTLFSGLAFAGVIYAILLQKDELSLQREELRLTREELKRAADTQADARNLQAAQLANEARVAELAALTALLDWNVARSAEQRKTIHPALTSLKLQNPKADAEELAHQINRILVDLKRGHP